jgi:hypothetical protein
LLRIGLILAFEILLRQHAGWVEPLRNPSESSRQLMGIASAVARRERPESGKFLLCMGLFSIFWFAALPGAAEATLRPVLPMPALLHRY